MKQKRLVKVKSSIEDFFYKMRYNVGLESIFATTEHEKFRKNIEEGLKDQILYYAKFEKVNEIIGLKKNHYESKDTQLKTNLEKIWIPLLAIIEEEELKNYFYYTANVSGQISTDYVTTGAVFELTNSVLTKRLDKRIGVFMDMVDNTTVDWLTRRIEQGIINGMTSLDIARMLRDDASSIAFDRSVTISEHETALIYGSMVKEVYKRNRIEEIRWITARDERVCPICMGNEQAGTVKIDKEFPDGSKAPPAHINCRCFILPVQNEKVEVKWTGS